MPEHHDEKAVIRRRLAAVRANGPVGTLIAGPELGVWIGYLADEVERIVAGRLADQRATEAVLRGEIRRAESALATFDAVVAERDRLRAGMEALLNTAGNRPASVAAAFPVSVEWYSDRLRALLATEGGSDA